jgi:predicted RNase H-like HicB family nuclease
METVHVIYHYEGGSWWAESPDVERWYAAGDSYSELVTLAEEGIPFALGREVKLEHFASTDEHAAA